jgi:hypothetical protein
MVYQEVTANVWRLVSVFFSGVLVVFSLTLSSCAVAQDIIVSRRKAGEQMVHTPQKTQEKYGCAPYRQAMLQLEEVQVLPDVVTPGKEINQRIRYAFCPMTPSGILKGSITRVVLFKGKEVFRDSTNYEFKPGTWTVDVFIGIPQEAGSGVYALDVALRYEKQLLKRSNSFIVKGR